MKVIIDGIEYAPVEEEKKESELEAILKRMNNIVMRMRENAHIETYKKEIISLAKKKVNECMGCRVCTDKAWPEVRNAYNAIKQALEEL